MIPYRFQFQAIPGTRRQGRAEILATRHRDASAAGSEPAPPDWSIKASQDTFSPYPQGSAGGQVSGQSGGSVGSAQPACEVPGTVSPNRGLRSSVENSPQGRKCDGAGFASHIRAYVRRNGLCVSLMRHDREPTTTPSQCVSRSFPIRREVQGHDSSGHSYRIPECRLVTHQDPCSDSGASRPARPAVMVPTGGSVGSAQPACEVHGAVSPNLRLRLPVEGSALRDASATQQVLRLI